MPAPHRSVFTGRMPFLPPNQQRQSTEGTMRLKSHFNQTTFLAVPHSKSGFRDVLRRSSCSLLGDYPIINYLQ